MLPEATLILSSIFGVYEDQIAIAAKTEMYKHLPRAQEEAMVAESTVKYQPVSNPLGDTKAYCATVTDGDGEHKLAIIISSDTTSYGEGEFPYDALCNPTSKTGEAQLNAIALGKKAYKATQAIQNMWFELGRSE